MSTFFSTFNLLFWSHKSDFKTPLPTSVIRLSVLRFRNFEGQLPLEVSIRILRNSFHPNYSNNKRYFGHSSFENCRCLWKCSRQPSKGFLAYEFLRLLRPSSICDNILSGCKLRGHHCVMTYSIWIILLSIPCHRASTWKWSTTKSSGLVPSKISVMSLAKSAVCAYGFSYQMNFTYWPDKLHFVQNSNTSQHVKVYTSKPQPLFNTRSKKHVNFVWIILLTRFCKEQSSTKQTMVCLQTQ